MIDFDDLLTFDEAAKMFSALIAWWLRDKLSGIEKDIGSYTSKTSDIQALTMSITHCSITEKTRKVSFIDHSSRSRWVYRSVLKVQEPAADRRCIKCLDARHRLKSENCCQEAGNLETHHLQPSEQHLLLVWQGSVTHRLEPPEP